MTHDVYNERNSMKKYIIFVILMSTISAMDPDELSKRATKAMQSTISSRVFDLLREENLEKPYAVSEFAHYLKDPNYPISNASKKYLIAAELLNRDGSLNTRVNKSIMNPDELINEATNHMQSTVRSRIIDLCWGDSLEKPHAAFEFAQYLKDPDCEISLTSKKHLIAAGLLNQDGSLDELVRYLMLKKNNMWCTIL